MSARTNVTHANGSTTVQASTATKAAGKVIVAEQVESLFADAKRIQKGLDRYNGQKQSLGTSMLQAAQSLGVDKFLEDCATKEKAVKARKGEVPKCWTQAKSNISQAHKAGLSLDDYGTEGSMRKALNEHRKAKKDAKQAEAAEQAKAEADTLEVTLARINSSFEGDERAELAAILEQAATAYLQSKLSETVASDELAKAS